MVDIARLYVEDFLIMKEEVDKNFVNSRIDKSRLLSMDNKNVKMIRNRINGVVATAASDIIKVENFLKWKAKIKTQFEKALDRIAADNIEGYHKHEVKMNQQCITILEEKYRKVLVVKAIEEYCKDTMTAVHRNEVLLDLDHMISKLQKFRRNLPYL